MQRGRGAGVAEPGGDLADGGAVGVVEVMTRGEDLDGAGAGSMERVEECGFKTLREEDVGRDLEAGEFKIQSRGCGGFNGGVFAPASV
jgi:hypothetical protein